MKRMIIFVMSLALILVMPVSVKADEGINVKSSILMCMNTGDIIAENNAYEHLSPASVTKIASFLVILEAIDSGRIALTDIVSASENAVSKGGSQIWLEVGEEMTVDELLKAVIIASANDACTALGEYIAGSEASFVSMMNDRATELGLTDSHFENCTGLDDEISNHYSCAYDLAVIASEVMKHSIVTDYSTIWLDSLRNGETELNNTNKLINTYNGITGLKTGTTSKAGFCLCATASRDGMDLVSVVLGATNSDDRFNKCSELLDFGFANYKLVETEFDISQISDVKVIGGVKKSIKPSIPECDKLLVSKNASDLEFEYKIVEEVKAPVNEGDELGQILVKCDGKVVNDIKLYSNESIEKITFSYILGAILKNI